MAVYGEFLKSEFPLIDDDLYQYVEGELFPNTIIHVRFSSTLSP